MAAKSRKEEEDIFDLPSYTISEAAHYLRIPTATLRSWILGRNYPTAGEGQKRFQPLINIRSRQPHRLSFTNLVEAHLLSVIRRIHNVQLPKVRKAISYLSKEFKSTRPLLEQEMETDGSDLFIRELGQLISASGGGQMNIKEILKVYLARIERNEQGFPIKLYPFSRKHFTEAPRAILIDPTLSFGRPTLSGTGIPIDVIAERYEAGESIEALSLDYGRPQLEIEEAIRYELQKFKAA